MSSSVLCKGFVFCVALAIVSLLGFQNNALAQSVRVKGSTVVNVYGFLNYEGGWSNRSFPSFYRSNTSYGIVNGKGKNAFSSEARLRLGFKITNRIAKTHANITFDSWPKGFSLMLAFVRHRIARGLYLTVGKDWSLVSQRYFHFASFSFRPYPAGFNGSKRTAQITASYMKDLGSSSVLLCFGAEDRSLKDGVVVGKNLSSNGTVISDSNISSERKILPAFVGKVEYMFKTGFGKPSQLMGYYEVLPVYLRYANKESRQTAYLYSIAGKLNFEDLALVAQYLHTSGLSGASGITGNALKTYSYVYLDGKIVKRDSNAFGVEIVGIPFKGLRLALGYVDLKFDNRNSSGKDFLKNEVKYVKTAYVTCVISTSKTTKLYAEWSNIKTRYATDNALSGDFRDAVGNQFFIGYRLYF